MADKIGNVWVFIEQEGGKIADVSLELVCKGAELAKQLGVEVEGVLLGDGVEKCCVKDGFYRRSLTAYNGYLTHEETSAIQNKPWIRPEDILGIADQKLDFAPPATVTRSTNFYK